jgi:hypothetical protein
MLWIVEIKSVSRPQPGCSRPTLTGGLWHFWALGFSDLRIVAAESRQQQRAGRYSSGKADFYSAMTRAVGPSGLRGHEDSCDWRIQPWGVAGTCSVLWSGAWSGFQPGRVPPVSCYRFAMICKDNVR